MRRKGLSALLAGIGFWVIAATCSAAEAESVRKVIDQYAALARSAGQRGTISGSGQGGVAFFRSRASLRIVRAFLGRGGCKGQQGDQTRICRSPSGNS